MMRLLSTICGTLVIAGILATQGSAQGGLRHRRNRPHSPADSSNPDAPPVQQYVPVVAQQPPAQPAAVRPPTPAPTPTPAAAAAPTPAVPEDLPPPTPPQVTYSDGLLTVQAMNSTLGGLLAAIHNKTGIQFEGLEGPANERVVISMGPASEGEVLAAILGGSKFDYVVLDRPDSPGTVQRVMLTPRGGATSASAGAPPGHPASAQGEGDDEDAPDEQASGDPEPLDTPVRPPLQQAQTPQQQQPQPQPQPDQATPRTPEQLMQQLMQMQQQQKQQGQQQPPQPTPQAPLKAPPIPQ